MKCTLVVVLLFSAAIHASGQNSGKGMAWLERHHHLNYHGPCQSYTFSQRNTHYRNDSVVGHSVWYEAIEFPDKFRIHFGDTTSGNFVQFRNDSVYRYKAYVLKKASVDSSSLLLILGGMYYRPFEDVAARFKKADFDVNELSRQEWLGHKVVVIGKEGGNQIWFDEKDEKVVRIIEKMPGGDVMDMRFLSHRKWCNGFVETSVSFRRSGKLEQEEEYYDMVKGSM